MKVIFAIADDWKESCTFHQMNEFCISQGSAGDIFTCKGQGRRFSQNLVGFPPHPSSLHPFCSPFLSYPFQLSPPKSNWGVWIVLWAARGRASADDQLNNYFRLEILNGDNFHSVTNFSPWQLGWVQCGLLMGWTQDTSKVVGSGPQDAGGNRRLWLRGNISQSRSQFFYSGMKFKRTCCRERRLESRRVRQEQWHSILRRTHWRSTSTCSHAIPTHQRTSSPASSAMTTMGLQKNETRNPVITSANFDHFSKIICSCISSKTLCDYFYNNNQPIVRGVAIYYIAKFENLNYHSLPSLEMCFLHETQTYQQH